MKRLFIILALLLLPVTGWTYDRYVDCDAAGGGDGNLATPYNTIAQVNSAELEAGDTVYFKRGCTWREMLTVPISGSDGSPITFGAYGTGANPIIDGENTRDNCIMINGKTNITIGQLTVKNSASHAIVAQGEITNVKVQNCDISASAADRAGIIFWATSGGGGNYISGNTIHNTGGDALTIFDTFSGSGTESYIQNNTIYSAAKFGLYHKANYYIIQNNTIYNCGTSGTANAAIIIQCELVSSGTGQNNIVRYNKLYGTVGDTVDADGILLDHWSTANQVYYNVVYDNDGRCINIYDSANASVYNNSCYGNLQDASFGSGGTRAEILLGGTAAKLSDGALIKNNAVQATAADAYAISVDANSYDQTPTITNNIWYATATNWYFWNAGGGANLTTWNGLTGVGTDINSDPLFANTANNDFKLRSNSPARRAGANVSLTSDFLGRPVPAAPDIGAYQFASPRKPIKLGGKWR